MLNNFAIVFTFLISTVLLSGCILENNSNEVINNTNNISSTTFTVHWVELNKIENLTYNISIPINETKAKEIYFSIIKEKPGNIESIKKTDFGWSIYYGNIVFGFQALINEKNKTIEISGGY